MLGILSPLLSAVPGVSHRFFGRVGGTSPAPWTGLNISHDVGDAPARVDENLARTRFQIGVGKDALFTAKQVHGNVVAVVDADSVLDAVRTGEADALVTTLKDTAVAVRTADCAPILLAVDDGSAVAAVHAGWRGAVGGVIENAVAALGVSPGRIVAAVGPCIGQDAFEVGPEVVAAAAAVVDAADLEGIVKAGSGDRQHLDLAALCERVLKKAGVTRVDVVGGCTVNQPSSYFSHRRDNGSTGRQLAAIAIAVPPDFESDTFR
ncbi:MAG TPA: peptidoglycan editing factor PgeF [Myxococcota bacterium]